MKTLARTLLALSVFCSAAFAANIPINVIGSTETQIVVSFVPTTSGCTVAAVDNNGGPPVNDVDPTKFPSANVIASRTNANGYRWPSYMRANAEVVIVGGHDEVKQGLDGAWYSTALQVASDHTITIGCGSDSGSVHVQTQNIQLGSNYPEVMIPQPSFFGDGSWPQPTIDYSVAGRAKTYVDPITGVLLTRMSDGLDNLDDGPCCGSLTIFTSSTAAMDQQSQWTSPTNGTTASTSPSVFASTSTANAPLFLPVMGGVTSGMTFSDMRVQLYGKGTSGSEIVGVCYSKDSGQTCASGEVTIPMSTTSGCQTYLTNATACEGIPNTRSIAPVYSGSTGNFPQGQFADWGGGFKNSYSGTYELINSPEGTISNVSISGSTMTSNNNTLPGFNVGRKAGSLVYLTGCTGGGPTLLLHISTVDAYNQITAQETGQSASGCTYRELAAGVRIVLKNSGTVQVAANVTHEQGRGASQGSNGIRWLCARSKVTDISTDCDGVTHAPPLSGFMCALDGTSAIYLLQDNGRVCLQSNGYGSATAGHVTFPASPFINNNTAIAQVFGTGQLYTLRFPRVPNDYTEYRPGVQHSNAADNATYTALTLTPSAVTNLVKTTPSVSADVLKAVNSGIWGNPTFQTAIDNPGGNPGLLWGWYAPGGAADVPCMFAVTDSVTGALTSTYATWNNSNGAASSSCHGSPYGISGYNVINVFDNAPAYFNTGQVFSGPFVSRGIGLHHPDGTFKLWALPSITSATNASPAVLTFSAVTDLDNIGALNSNAGAWATCSGGTGSWAGLNGTVYLHNPSTAQRAQNTTALVYADAKGLTPINSTTWGSFSGQTITCSVMPPIYGFALYNVFGVAGFNTGVTGAASSGFMRVVPNVTDLGYLYNYPSGKLPIQDGDPIVLSGAGLSTQYYAKVSCTGCQASGTVNVSGSTVTWVSGTTFSTAWVNNTEIVINGSPYSIQAVASGTSMTLWGSPVPATGAPYSIQQVDLYTDSALTQPLVYNSTLATNIGNGYIAYAETCPDPATVNTSWNFKDSGIGTSGNPLVRCVTIRLNTEPCSDYASSGEHSSYPCPSDPSNTARSSIHNINIGDGLFDLSGKGSSHEIMPVISENKASETQIDVTVERWYGDIVGHGHDDGVCGYITPCQQDNYANSHAPGWMAQQVPISNYYYFNINQLSATATPSTVGIGHNDISYGTALTTLSFAQSYLPGADSIWSVPVSSMFSTTITNNQKNYPYWNGDTASPIQNNFCGYGCEQTYTNCRQVPGVAATQDANWCADWSANNPDSGHFANAFDAIANRTLTKIRGTTYDTGNTTSYVYKITPVGLSTTTSIKTFPLMVVNGVHQYLYDASSPVACSTGGESGCLTDSSIGSYCRAYNAGECRPNSSAGDIFIAIRGVYDPGYCASSNNTLPDPCAVVSSPIGGWAIERRLNPPTTDGNGIRKMTLGWHAPTEHEDYSNWLISPDAKWGFFANYAANTRARYQVADTQVWWMMKLPPWAPYDNVKRSSFVNVPITFAGMSGDTYRIKFWYGENAILNTGGVLPIGNGPTFVTGCTTRQEACWTSSSANSTNPFVFASETQHKTSCSSGCTINIPAIPGRIVFYQVERTHGGNVTLGAVEPVAVP